MGLVEIFITGIGLSMDAFAVSICKGLSMKKFKVKSAIIIGLYFGLFHVIMPLIGYLLGTSFESYITSFDHWIAFGLLSFIGVSMILEGFSKDEDKKDDKIDFKSMFPLALATSIDALALGITFAFLKVNLFIALPIISIITFIFSFVGVKIGNKFGNKYNTIAELLGGIVLILIGLKILFEHLNII